MLRIGLNLPSTSLGVRVYNRFAYLFAGPFPQYVVVPSGVPVNSNERFADHNLRPELGWFTNREPVPVSPTKP